LASNGKKYNKLVVFDVEGVLIPKARFILFEISTRLGLRSFIFSILLGILYEIGFLSLKKALKYIFKLSEGYSLKQYLALFQNLPLTPGLINVFKELKKANYKIALISSGIPKIALEKLNENLKADYIYGLEIGLSGEKLTGDIWGDVIEPNGKAVALQEIIHNNSLSPCICTCVADDRNNLPLFKICDLRIGYNPDYVLSHKSDYVCKGNLLKIIPIIKGEHIEKRGFHLVKSSIIREVIHIGGFLIPLVCIYFLNCFVIISLILLTMLIYIASETMRMMGKEVPIITSLTIKATEEQESQGFVISPIFYALSITFSLILFPEPISYVSIAVLTFGDGFAALIGQHFGRNRIRFNKLKNVEGVFGGFIFAFLGCLIFVNPIRALIASAVGMFVEILPLPINDNLTVPIATGLSLIIFAF
jgi:dolichol kinase/phosphoserine phosphatase